MGTDTSAEWKGYKHQLLQDTSIRGILIEGTEEKGASKVLRHPRAKNGTLGFLRDDGNNELDTAWNLFTASYKKSPSHNYTGFRPFTDAMNDPKKRGPYKWLTYQQFGDLAISYGCGLRSLGIKDHSNIGIFSKNRPEWFIAHMGNVSQAYRSTALYDTLGPDAVSYIVHHAQVPVILTEKSKLKTLLAALTAVQQKSAEAKEEFPVQYIIQIDYNAMYGNTHEKVDEEDRRRMKASHGIEMIGLNELIGRGNEARDRFEDKHLPSKEDTCYIMYTSGTTGDPKGVVLSHRSFAATVASMSRSAEVSEYVHVSYLPLAHIFEAVIISFVTSKSGQVAYYQGSIRKIADDWKAIRPTILIGVPRIFNKTYEKFQLKVSKMASMQKWFMQVALEKASENIRYQRRNELFDGYLWSEVSSQLGYDRVQFVLSGAAPLPPHVAEFLRIILPGAKVQEGYGLTEVCAAGATADLDDCNLGHIGAPVDTMEIRLLDAPECGYLTTDVPYPRGEVQIRGLNLMDGYYKNEAATNKCLDKESGWFSTGDIARLNPNGTISIIDRRKNLFKTAMGEYIASEKVENTYLAAPLIGQIWIYGNSYKSFIIAVIVPDAEVLVERLKGNGLWTERLKPGSKEYCALFKEVCERNVDLVKKWIKEDMKQYEKDLLKFTRVRDFIMEFEIDAMLTAFNEDNGLMTPTFKKKRPQLLNKYVEPIKELYANNGEPPAPTENWLKK